MWWTWSILLFLPLSSSTSHIRFHNGAYSGIRVSISDKIPQPASCQDFLTRIEVSGTGR